MAGAAISPRDPDDGNFGLFCRWVHHHSSRRCSALPIGCLAAA